MAVLYRTNAQARNVTLSFRNAKIPFRVRADADLFAQPEVRDLVANLRLAHCPTDGPALARIINVPPRRLRAIEQALRKRPVPVDEPPVWAQKRGGPTARRSVEALLALLEDVHRETEGRRPGEVLTVILKRIPYSDWLEAQKDGQMKLKAVEALRGVIEATAAPDLGTWLIDAQLGESDVPAGADTKCVTLTTIHGAKGAEWPVVFVIGCEEGLLPHGRHPTTGKSTARGEDEERRLAYVAFSRTQVLLYLVYCRTRRHVADPGAGRVEFRQPSRFLLGLPADLLERIDNHRAA